VRSQGRLEARREEIIALGKRHVVEMGQLVIAQQHEEGLRQQLLKLHQVQDDLQGAVVFLGAGVMQQIAGEEEPLDGSARVQGEEQLPIPFVERPVAVEVGHHQGDAAIESEGAWKVGHRSLRRGRQPSYPSLTPNSSCRKRATPAA